MRGAAVSYSDFPAIVVEIGGRTQRLSTAKQWRTAVRQRRIERETLILFEASETDKREIFAFECEALAPVFVEVFGEGSEQHEAKPAGSQRGGSAGSPFSTKGVPLAERLERLEKSQLASAERQEELSGQLAGLAARVADLAADTHAMARRLAEIERQIPDAKTQERTNAPTPTPTPTAQTRKAEPGPSIAESKLAQRLIRLSMGLTQDVVNRDATALDVEFWTNAGSGAALAKLAPSEGDRFWLKVDPDDQGSALLIPGLATKMEWPSLRTMGKDHPLTPFFELETGPDFEIVRAAVLAKNAKGAWELAEKGFVRGLTG